jgi:uncharacterized protein (DUF362 family)
LGPLEQRLAPGEDERSVHQLSRVVVARSSYDDLYSTLSKVLERLGMPKLKLTARIAIKINLCDARTPETGAITHPSSLGVLLRILREQYGDEVNIRVVEADATVSRPDLFVKWLGILPIVKRWHAEYVNLSREDCVNRKIEGRHFKEVAVPETLWKSDLLINMSKMKTHSLTKITGALKNQYGCLPFSRKIIFHRNIDDVIVDVNLAVRPHLCIVDGIVAQITTKGPAFGKPIKAGVLIVGNDPVAVDATCARIMGFNPFFVGHVRKAWRAGLGNIRTHVDLVGLSELPRVNAEFDMFEYLFIKIIRFIGRIRRMRSRKK